MTAAQEGIEIQNTVDDDHDIFSCAPEYVQIQGCQTNRKSLGLKYFA